MTVPALCCKKESSDFKQTWQININTELAHYVGTVSGIKPPRLGDSQGGVTK